MIPSGFLQTLVGAFSRQSTVLQPTNRALDFVTKDIGFDAKPLGSTVDIPVSVPVQSQIVNQVGVGYTAPTYNTYNVNFVPIQLTNLISYSVAIPSIDTLNTDANIQRLLVDPAMKAVENQANQLITALFTATNFNVNAVIPTTSSIVTTKQFVQGRTNLRKQYVETNDPTNVVFLEGPDIFASMLTDPSWVQENQVGINIAEEARAMGVMRTAYGAAIAEDQAMPVSGAAGSQTFTSFYGTKQAIAVALRPVPAGDPQTVHAAYTDYKGLPILLELSYLGKDRQWYMNVMLAMGQKVVRPDQGQLFSTAQ